MTNPVDGAVTRRWRPGWPVDAGLTLKALAMGRHDPTHQVDADGSLWRTGRMATGPVTYRLAQARLDLVDATAWGPGAAELLETMPELLGDRDRPETFRAGHPVLEEAFRRLRGLRVPRTGLLFESLVPAVLRQKIQGRDASRAWRYLVTLHGAPAPGPRPGMWVPPTPVRWQEISPRDWRRAGVEPSAATTIRLAAARADALDRAVDGSLDSAYRAMTSIRGVGRWTAAEVGHRALGDADALPLGDYHMASLTGWALTGRPLRESEVEPFYERWRPHRYRAMRLLELTPWAWPPRRGPRMERPEHRYGSC